MQFTKWHSKSRLTGTQALDKVWSHLKRNVPKSLCNRSKSDRRFNPRMEQYVYSYMWRFNNRNWWKQLGRLCQQQWKKSQTSVRMKFFFLVVPTSQCKIAKIKPRTQFWRVFYTSIKIQKRKKRENYQWFWYDPCCPRCKLPGVLNNAGTMFFHQKKSIPPTPIWQPYPLESCCPCHPDWALEQELTLAHQGTSSQSWHGKYNSTQIHM